MKFPHLCLMILVIILLSPARAEFYPYEHMISPSFSPQSIGKGENLTISLQLFKVNGTPNQWFAGNRDIPILSQLFLNGQNLESGSVASTYLTTKSQSPKHINQDKSNIGLYHLLWIPAPDLGTREDPLRINITFAGLGRSTFAGNLTIAVQADFNGAQGQELRSNFNVSVELKTSTTLPPNYPNSAASPSNQSTIIDPFRKSLERPRNETIDSLLAIQSLFVSPFIKNNEFVGKIVFGKGSTGTEVAGAIPLSQRLGVSKEVVSVVESEITFNGTPLILIGTPCENTLISTALQIPDCAKVFTEDIGFFTTLSLNGTKGYIITGNSSPMIRAVLNYFSRPNTRLPTTPLIIRSVPHGIELENISTSKRSLYLFSDPTSRYRDFDGDGLPDPFDSDLDGDSNLDITQGIFGNHTHIKTNLAINVTVASQRAPYYSIIRRTVGASISRGDARLVWFLFELGESDIDFSALSFIDTSLQKGGGMLFSGLDFNHVTEIRYYFQRELARGQKVCIKKGRILDLNSISTYCDSINEQVVPCDGENHDGTNCTIMNGSERTFIHGKQITGVAVMGEPRIPSPPVFASVTPPNWVISPTTIPTPQLNSKNTTNTLTTPQQSMQSNLSIQSASLQSKATTTADEKSPPPSKEGVSQIITPTRQGDQAQPDEEKLQDSLGRDPISSRSDSVDSTVQSSSSEFPWIGVLFFSFIGIGGVFLLVLFLSHHNSQM